MNKENMNSPFELNEQVQEQINLTMVKMLFKILYQTNKITKKEFESLINNADRTPKSEINWNKI